MLNFSRLLEILYSCHCMQFCALPGTQASSQLTEKGTLLPLWKGKGDRQDCNNYRGVTLLSVLGKEDVGEIKLWYIVWEWQDL